MSEILDELIASVSSSVKIDPVDVADRLERLRAAGFVEIDQDGRVWCTLPDGGRVGRVEVQR